MFPGARVPSLGALRRCHRYGSPINSRVANVEDLETRRLLSVSAVDLIGPQTSGTVRRYVTTEPRLPDRTTVDTVIGSTTFNGHSVTETDEAVILDAPFADTFRHYESLTSDGFVDFGRQETDLTESTDPTEPPKPVTRHTTETESFDLELPAFLTAGVAVAVTNTTDTLTDFTPETTFTNQFTVTLESETPTMVTVPAGTFSCYAIDDVFTEPARGTITNYYAIDVGLVESVENSASLRMSLTEFHAASPSPTPAPPPPDPFPSFTPVPTPTYTLLASLNGEPPATAIAGQRMKFLQTLVIDNVGSNAADGTFSVDLYLAGGTSIDGNSVKFDSLTKHEQLNRSGRVRVPLKLSGLPASLASGTYHILARVTDPAGETIDVEGEGSVAVAAAIVDLSGTFARQPVAGKGGRTNSSLVLHNAGNVAAAGPLAFDVDTSPDGLAADASKLTHLTKTVNIKPGKTRKITLSVVVPASRSFLVVDLDPDNAFADPNLDDNVFATTAALTVI